MLQGTPDAAAEHEAAAAFGLLLHSEPAPPCEVWADHWPAVRLFIAVQSQWRTGPAGPIGLDYSALPAWVRPGGPRRGRRVLQALQVLEAEALAWFAERRAD